MVKKLSLLIKILIAFALDLIFGDPHWLPHPVQLIGKLISGLEKLLYRKKLRRFSGTVLNVTVLICTFMLCSILARNSFVEIYLMYTIFSTKCLANEGKRIYNILVKGDMKEAREKLSYLVSRDTDELTQRDIIRSTMETISENTVDGIIAPLFFMFLGGMPLAMTYKAVNTMDSMLGYKNNKYKEFGFFSAKLDDYVNYAPARLTGGILMPFSAMICGFDYKKSLEIYQRDKMNHSSPNSGHPEAAVAGALGIQFGGETSYFGKVHEKPTIGDKLKDFEIEDIKKNIKLMYGASFAGLGFMILLYFAILTLEG